MIDPGRERVYPFRVLANDMVGRKGKGIHVATMHRWAKKGMYGIQLEYLCQGGTKATSKEAISRFFAAVTAADRAKKSSVIARTSAREQRERAIAAAERELDKAGI